MSNIDLKRRTKIVATIGPATQSEEIITDLIKAGVTTFRLNFSHGDHKDHEERIKTIRKVSVKKRFRATLPKDDLRRESAYQWLRDQGLGDIIKNNVSVSFGKGEDNKANQLMDLAVANGYTPQQKSDVAWNTLTALYEERVKAGLDMPSDVFSLWIKDETKISRKK